MRWLAALGIAASLFGATSVDVLVPGVSYHPNWDEPGEPNPWNYGLGLSLTYTKPDDIGQAQIGGMVYNDSFGETAVTGFGGLGIRTLTRWSAEAMFGLAYWNGSGTYELTPVFYVGTGYAFTTVSVFVDVMASNDVIAGWLKFSVPVN